MLKFVTITLTLWAATLAAQDNTLIGGSPVKPGSFDAVVRISMGNGSCSATVVSERVLVTAAHCARGGQQVSFMHNKNRYTARCEGHPSYPRQDLDVSLCLIDKPVLASKPASISFEGVKRGDTMTLTGYGCVRPGGGGGNDGILRIGFSQVSGFTNTDIVTKGLAASCFGDSGSSNYAGKIDGFQHLKVAGITSKGNIKDTSYITNLSLPTYKTWMEDYERRVKQEICGVSKVCGEQEEDPKDPEDPKENDCIVEKKIFNFFSVQTKLAQQELEACESK